MIIQISNNPFMNLNYFIFLIDNFRIFQVDEQNFKLVQVEHIRTSYSFFIAIFYNLAKFFQFSKINSREICLKKSLG